MVLEKENQKVEQLDPIFDLLKENKVSDAIAYIKSGKLSNGKGGNESLGIDAVQDEHGTTLLQYASFRGMYDLVELLLTKGADPNAKTHDQGYSALMFAAISNQKACVQRLLQADAHPDQVNQIGRTVAAMAAFVQATECADLCNAYVSRKSLDYFTKVHGLKEKEPKLPVKCVSELHKLLISHDYSPIFILRQIRMSKDNVLVEHSGRIAKTLDSFCERTFKDEKADCPNDLLAFKLHLFKFMYEFLASTRKTLEALTPDSKVEDNKVFDVCFKQLLSKEEVTYEDKDKKAKVKVMCRVFEEKMLREVIRQFPFGVECALIRNLVTVISAVPIGKNPSALFVITSYLNGQRMNDSVDENGHRQVDVTSTKTNSETGAAQTTTVKMAQLECATCYHKSVEAKWCTHCNKVAYCDQFCQKLDWSVHKRQTVQ